VTALERSATSGIAALQAGQPASLTRSNATMRPRGGSSSCGARRARHRRRTVRPGGRRPLPARPVLGGARPALHAARSAFRARRPVRSASGAPGRPSDPARERRPCFLLKTAELSVQLGAADRAPRTYAASVSGVTSDPALYGRPATASATAPDFRLGALLDHVRPRLATPLRRARRGRAASALAAVAAHPARAGGGHGGAQPRGAGRRGSRAAGPCNRIACGGPAIRAAPPPHLLPAIWSGVSCPGSRRSRCREPDGKPRPSAARRQLEPRSRTGRAGAGGAGAELAVAERRVRAQVDSLVDGQVAPALAKVTALGGDVTRRLGGERTQLDDAARRWSSGCARSPASRSAPAVTGRSLRAQILRFARVPHARSG